MDGFFFFPKIVKEAMKSLAEATGSKQAPIEGDNGIVSYNDHNILVCKIEMRSVLNESPRANTY